MKNFDHCYQMQTIHDSLQIIVQYTQFSRIKKHSQSSKSLLLLIIYPPGFFFIFISFCSLLLIAAYLRYTFKFILYFKYKVSDLKPPRNENKMNCGYHLKTTNNNKQQKKVVK